MRFLFVKESLAWPRSSGHDVHGFHMMKALVAKGHEVYLLTAVPPSGQALEGLRLSGQSCFGDYDAGDGSDIPLTKLQAKFCSYWGIERSRLAATRAAADQFQADVVVAVGLEVLPYLAGTPQCRCVWYAADEWVWHHLSQMRLMRRSSWSNGKEAAIKGLYERAFAPLLDRVWVVSQADRMAMRWVTGLRTIDVIPNGVDTDHFRPQSREEIPASCIFWGRLDFGPNLDAMNWFVRAVWPLVRQRQPNARLSIFGFQPGEQALAWNEVPGVTVIADREDIRRDIAEHQVVVLPFLSGGGIKNKLLEAASMARPIVASRTACNGLAFEGNAPMHSASSPQEWAERIGELFASQEKRHQLGQAARTWILQNHQWDSAAQKAALPLVYTFDKPEPTTLTAPVR